MWSVPFSIALFLLNIQNSYFPDHSEDLNLTYQLEEGLYVPVDSAGYLFTRVYFDPETSSLKTYIACAQGDCDHVTFEMTEIHETYYSSQVDSTLGWKTEIYMIASDEEEMVMMARIWYPDASPQSIIQKFIRKQ